MKTVTKKTNSAKSVNNKVNKVQTNKKTASIIVDAKKGQKQTSIYELRRETNNSLKKELYSLNQVIKFIKEQSETNNKLHVYLLALNFDISKLNTKLIVNNWSVKNDAGKLCYNYKGIIKEKSKFSIWDILKTIEAIAKKQLTGTELGVLY